MSKPKMNKKIFRMQCIFSHEVTGAEEELLNKFTLDYIYDVIFSKMDITIDENVDKIEKFITGFKNCYDFYGKEDGNIAKSILLKPYYASDFNTSNQTVEEIVKTYTFVGERIQELVGVKSGVVVLT